MSEETIDTNLVAYQQMRNKALGIGALVGAVIGTVAAYVYINKYKEGDQPSISTREGVRLALLVAALLRGVGSM